MKKRIIVTILGIIIIVVGIIVITSKQRKIYTEIDGVKYSILVNGQSATSFPSGNYKVDVDCTNAKGYWDAVQQKVIIKDITGIASCCVEFLSITSSDYLNNYVISLENDTNQGNGTVIHETVSEFTTIDNQVTTEAGYRYEGANPNNYVWFNNELWRIIGVFGQESHGKTNKQLVKIISDKSMGLMVWNIDEVNNWNTSSLKAVLNGAYYNHTTDTENCYADYSTSTISTTCDYSIDGIQSEYQGMIENVTWYLGGGGASGYQTHTAPMEYQYERTGIVYSGRPTIGEGKIGLMYASDYLYGVKESDCSRTTNANSAYNTADCAGKNWLLKCNGEWTISQNSSSADYKKVYYVDSIGEGCLYNQNSKYGSNARPVLYLSEKTYRISGTGTQADPYIIGLASN